MSTRLVILGLLKERPLYGYELKGIIERYMGDWTSIAFGSIYFALNKLTKEGLVREIAVQKEGSRPSRRVYEVTEAGKDAFTRLLRDVWSKDERTFSSFDVGLFFLRELPKKERIAYLQNRIESARRSLTYLDGHETEMLAKPMVPPLASAIFSHSRYHAQAELSWLEELLREMQEGRYE
jgi:DNA-binding PadR family transcriptional regulator